MEMSISITGTGQRFFYRSISTKWSAKVYNRITHSKSGSSDFFCTLKIKSIVGLSSDCRQHC